MNINSALKSNRLCKSLTGLSPGEFSSLANNFNSYLLEVKIKANPNRKIAFGNGRPSNLKTIEDKLFFILMYLKCYPTLDVLGFFCNLDKSNCCRNVTLLMSALELTLKRKFVLPERRISSVEEFFEKFPEAKDIFMDGTERRVQRPKNKKKQNKTYSGKKKTTTRKNIIASDEHKKIMYLSETKSGRRHDKKLADKMGVENIPKNVAAWGDTGFIGIQKVHSNTKIPTKKPKGGKLTWQQKESNKLISSIRVVGEHAIAGIKRLNSVSHVYRNRKIKMDDTLMLLASGIWNYHLSFTQ